MIKEAQWRDFAPAIGSGVGALVLGAGAAMIGDRKKRIRNAILGAIAGGLGGAAYGSMASQLLDDADRNRILEDKLKDANTRASAAGELAERFDHSLRHIGIKGMSASDRAEALEEIAQRPYTIKHVMSEEDANEAGAEIPTTKGQKIFELYHDVAKRFGPNGKHAFLPIPISMLYTTSKIRHNDLDR